MERILARKACKLWSPCVLSCSRNMSSVHGCIRYKPSQPQQTIYPQNSGLLQRNLQKNSTMILRCFEQEKKKEKTMSWKAFGVMTLCCCGLYAIYEYFEQERKKEKMKAAYKNVGSPQIGGSWILTDHNGIQRSSKEFKGTWLLIYFGFTHCPDVCPDELEKIAAVVKHFNSKPAGPKIKPLFVTIDPERDTKEIMKKYCEEFTPELLGLTGTKEELQDIYSKFRVYFRYGEPDNTGDYLVDHTLVTYLMTPDGIYSDHFGKKSTLDLIKENITLRMEKYSSKS
ncbi:protein SCO1 homolog, mitochondrial-like [Ylistrum balloti]|uniref:protein SCO1 homolog, mitochondrial-like n=1 Tax=Ylistrum balloti TaxID=509963 RepID=UPI002905EF06|nr:protein SCO1 homolog, mitochondrial-like [Ylistrum balloti]